MQPLQVISFNSLYNMSKENDMLREEVKQFLNAHRKAIFAISDKEGFPTTSLMLYAIDDNVHVYFGTRKAFGKYADILARPIVSLSVVEEKLDPLIVVDVRGVATQVPDEECERTHAFLKSKNTSKYYVEDAPDFVMFKIVPSFIRYANASSGALVIKDIDV
jgi:general stress protein 26